MIEVNWGIRVRCEPEVDELLGEKFSEFVVKYKDK